MRPACLCALFLAIFVTPFWAQSSQPSLVEPDWCRSLPRPDYKTLEKIPVDDPWFEAYRVAPGVIVIYEPHQWEETLVYLIEGTRRAVLLDTGMGIGNLKAVVTKLTPLPILVVNSHTHPDHTGNNWQFATVYNLDTEYSRENALGGTEIRAEIEPGKICGTLPGDFNPSTYATRPWKTTKWLHDGDKIDLGGRQIVVLATPGHAPDSLCLFDETNGLLFTGDLYYPGEIYVFGKGADPAEYQQSVDRLAKLAPKVKAVFGAHNSPVSPPSVLIELAKEFDEVQAGKISGTDAGGGVMRYNGVELTFLVKAK